MERMMKVQDVLLKAMARKITWWAAAEILGVTDRTMRRWREKLEKDGYAGLADRRKGKPSAQRIPLATIEKVLGLYKETYYDLNIRHFHEKLRDQHGMELSYTWVQKALQGAGLVAKRHKRGPHRRRRPRRSPSGASASKPRRIVKARPKPRTAPPITNTRLSANDWRMRSQRPAPRAARTAISRLRPDARASIRPAILEQAIRSTNPTAPSSTRMGVLVLPAMKSVKDIRDIPQAELLANSPFCVPLLRK